VSEIFLKFSTYLYLCFKVKEFVIEIIILYLQILECYRISYKISSVSIIISIIGM